MQNEMIVGAEHFSAKMIILTGLPTFDLNEEIKTCNFKKKFIQEYVYRAIL